ncbi:MAG: patatin-like phospholipase family protein [Gemmataceae bacterium]
MGTGQQRRLTDGARPPRRLVGVAGWLLAVALGLLAGCHVHRDLCVPPALTRSGVAVDLSSPWDEYRPVDLELFPLLARRLRGEAANAEPPGCPNRPLNVLVLSGGGKFGAYTAGVMSGWADARTRPDFDIVTGVSTGSIVACYAFLGPEYDAKVRDLYLHLRKSDIYRRRCLPALAVADSISRGRPLRRLYEREVTDALLAEVARRHAAGKRFYVGTTNLDASRLTVWDMGAIASSHRPDRLPLFRDVLLASASVPGVFPPVTLQVTFNGQTYTERHVDGGAISELFLPSSVLRLDPEAVRRGERPLAGSNVWIVVAGKLYADPKCAPSGIRAIAAGSLAALTYAQARNDTLRLFVLTGLVGMNYHLMSLDQDAKVSADALAFEPDELNRLFDHGYIDGRSGTRWRNAPPGSRPGEPVLPRTGTDFLAPVVLP